MRALQINRKTAESTPSLSLVTCATPKPAPGFALVKIHCSSIQPSDKLNAKGGFPKTTYPRIPGRDFSGEVVDVNAGSTAAVWIGKQVYGTSGQVLGFSQDGVHAEFALIPEAMLVEKPVGLSPCQAAAVGVPFTTALACLARARASPSDTVLVLGATGQVGSAAMQLAKALGCRRVLAASRRADADVVLPTTVSAAGSENTVSQQVAALTDNKGVDIVVDTVGDTELMGLAVPLLAACGRYTWIASPRDGRPTTVAFDIFQAYRKEIELIGCNSAAVGAEDVAKALRILKKFFDDGKLTGPAEADIQRVRLDDALGRGYHGQKEKRHVVIEMA